ncbi:MAG: hypothetical protein KJP00_12250 [Bacteroidia bacterium]|nr:hypothetical protein [Bacteroidia bacterium]
MTRIILSIALICACSFVSLGQSDFTTMIAELSQLVKDKGDDEISDVWETIRPRINSLSEEQKIELSNLLTAMKTTRLSLNPYYKAFFNAYQVSGNSDMGEETYDQWIVTLQNLLGEGQNNKANRFKSYMDFSAEYFKAGSLRISKGGTNWKSLSFQKEIGFEETGPYLVFEEVDLMAYQKKDTMMINKTSGTYYPLDNTWKGNGGFTFWEEGEQGKIKADFNEYELDTKKGIYEVNDALLTFERFFDQNTLKGSFQDKLSSESSKSHPRFNSEGYDWVINDLGKNLSLRGGIELKGNNLYVVGNDAKRAALQARNVSGEVKFRLESDSYAVKKSENISGNGLTATLYLGQDSIYHPSVNVNYNIAENTLRIFRGETALDQVPFFDSYHNFNVQTEEIKWYINQDSLVYGEKKKGISSDIKTLYFESPDYFSEREFVQIQSISSVNPIVILKIMSDKSGSTTHEALAVAKRINPKYNLGSVQTLFFDLVSRGFIKYDKNKELIEVRDKVFHYADASRNRIDYDRLKITSRTSESNAIVDTKSNEMTVSNVKGVELSSQHRVAIVPNDKRLKLLKNRSMKMDGIMFAGLSSFEGKEFFYDYDKFLVRADSIDFLDFFVPPTDGSKEPVGLSSRLEKGSGTLLIDAPGNKSASEHIPLFPSFSSKNPFYVFYDSAQDSAYARSGFYFELDQFGFNNLDSFYIDDVQFDGKLFSQEIFEPFEETIQVQQDFSLGFVSSTEMTGRPLYQSKANFVGDIALNNQGLTGIGKLNYLQAELESKDIRFLPKNLFCSSESLSIEEASTPVSVPSMNADGVDIALRPYQDSMIIRSQENPFRLFRDEQAQLEGTLYMRPQGLNGSGSLDWDQGTLDSESFEFKAMSVLADTSNLFIKASGGELAFDTRNVKSEIDFDRQKAFFKANSTDISTTMPYNKYKTSMNEFVWDIPEKLITFTSKGTENAYFLSTDSNQDSLIFSGKEATYNIAESTLKVSGNDELQIGDAIIITNDGKINIEPGGQMKTLENATIYVDQVNKQHVINESTVQVLGKKAYTASGYYAYNIGNKQQRVLLNNIVGKRSGKGPVSEQVSVTKASGEIGENEKFYIDEKTMFSGSMSLNGDSKDLVFKGFAKLDAPLLPERSWFSINSKGDKKDLFIQYDSPRNKDGAPIKTGIFISKESALTYPSVMNPLYFRKDRPIIDTKGQFTYDESNETFIFGDSLKLVGKSRKGNILKYNNATAEVFAEGVMNICPKVQPIIPMKSVGRILTKFKTKEEDQSWSDIPEPVVNAEIMTSFNIPIPKAMMDQMAVDFRSSTFDATKPNYSGDDFYTYAVSEFVKKESQYEDALKYLNENNIEIPRVVDKSSFILGKTPMKWDPDYQSFVSKPGKIPLMSIDGNPINIMVEAFVEYKMTTNEDDRLYIYLKSPSGLFYFFGFQGGILNITSDNNRFMTPLNDMKDKERIVEISKEMSFEMQGVTEGTANKFIQRAKAAWQN